MVNRDSFKNDRAAGGGARGMHSVQYDKAVDSLQAIGFTAELYITSTDVIVRWFKKGSKWHATAQLQHGALPDLLNVLGKRVGYWLAARESGTADECQHAVRE